MTAPVVEQPAEWTEPGAHPVVPGMHRVPLAPPRPSPHSVNVYVIEDAGGLVGVDSGWAMPDVQRAVDDHHVGVSRVGARAARLVRNRPVEGDRTLL